MTGSSYVFTQGKFCEYPVAHQWSSFKYPMAGAEGRDNDDEIEGVLIADVGKGTMAKKELRIAEPDLWLDPENQVPR